jgi:hypothetical protein
MTFFIFKKYVFFKKFYSKIKKSQINFYQYYFNLLTKSVNLQNMTSWLTKSEGNYKLYKLDNDRVTTILGKAKNKSLNSLYLQIMLDQYILADPWTRERHRTSWVKTVINRNNEDFFPDPYLIIKNLYLEE